MGELLRLSGATRHCALMPVVTLLHPLSDEGLKAWNYDAGEVRAAVTVVTEFRR